METVTIYTDGSSRGNPGRGGFAAICIYPDAKGIYHVNELGGHEAETTNNRMELSGLIVALDNLQGFYGKNSGIIFSFFIDSSYVLKGANTWLRSWKIKNWMTSAKEEVKNSDLWRKVDILLKIHLDNGVTFRWNLIKGHAEIPGNERCDEIATSFADNEKVALYKGHLSEYHIPNILETWGGSSASAADSVDGFASKNKNSSSGLRSSLNSKKSKSSKPAYSYVSYVDGQMHSDKTWADCEKRVKGKSGAKFKKAFSKEDESEIMSQFRG